MSETQPTPIDDAAVRALNNVTALEAWCLAAAIASLIADGNEQTSDLIASSAEALHTFLKEHGATNG